MHRVIIIIWSFRHCHVIILTIILISARSARFSPLLTLLAMFPAHWASWYRRAVRIPPPAGASSATLGGPQTTPARQQSTVSEQAAPVRPRPPAPASSSLWGGQTRTATADGWQRTRPSTPTNSAGEETVRTPVNTWTSLEKYRKWALKAPKLGPRQAGGPDGGKEPSAAAPPPVGLTQQQETAGVQRGLKRGG